ncbi:MAG TPA: elongation factor G [Candidatus Krumholzibacteria bacterium]|nr:elongation factor G [Candidatus Krumholzibacteria bacterium]
MKQFPASQIRNVALVGHQESGRTMLSESLLFTAGSIPRLGRIEDGNTTMDYDREEIARGISIHSGVAWCEHNGHKINIIDTPGYEDFVGDVLLGLDVAEGAIVTIRGDAGVEVGTDRVWGFVQEHQLPGLFVVNRMDKEHANFDAALEGLTEHFGHHVQPIQLPIGSGDHFRGVVDIVEMKAYEFEKDGKGGVKPIDIPAALKERVEALRKELMESAAESDEKLMEKYLETEALTEEEFRTGLAVGVKTGQIFPVLCASALHNMGAAPILDAIVKYLPGADTAHHVTTDGKEIPFDVKGNPAAYVFKNISDPHIGDMLVVRVYHGTLTPGSDVHNTTRNTSERLGQLFVVQGKNRQDTDQIHAGDIGALVKLKITKVCDTLADKASGSLIRATPLPKPSINAAISPLTKGDDEKMGTGLHRLQDEDPTFEVVPSAETHQTLIYGQGELHLEIIVHKLKERFGVGVTLDKPRIPYKETIRKKAEAQGRHKKQTGGRGQFGDVWLRVEPLPRGQQFEFVDGIVGGVVPGKFVPAVEKGIVATMEMGVIAGYQMIDVKATIYDGSYHTVDSSEQAFKTAGSLAFKAAIEKAGPVLLEPIVILKVKVPDEFLGDVMGDLSGRRGKIQGTENVGRFAVVTAQVPMAELYKYSTHLRSMTQGRGSHTREISHYEEVPREIAEKIIAEHKAAVEAQNK